MLFDSHVQHKVHQEHCHQWRFDFKKMLQLWKDGSLSHTLGTASPQWASSLMYCYSACDDCLIIRLSWFYPFKTEEQGRRDCTIDYTTELKKFCAQFLLKLWLMQASQPLPTHHLKSHSPKCLHVNHLRAWGTASTCNGPLSSTHIHAPHLPLLLASIQWLMDEGANTDGI